MILHNVTSDQSLSLPVDGVIDYPDSSAPTKDQARIILRHKAFAVILQVINGVIYLNGLPVRETALVYPGDVLHINDDELIVVRDDSLPPQCGASGATLASKKKPDTALSKFESGDEAVGIRWLGGALDGRFQVIPRQAAIDCGAVTVLGMGGGLVLLPCRLVSSDGVKATRVNGYAVFKANTSPIALRHGDTVHSGQWRFRVELPGDVRASAFSPSHPHNIQLSEEYLPEAEQAVGNSQKQRRFPWLVAVGGSILLLGLLLWQVSHV